MTRSPASLSSRAGTAMVWQGLQLGGVNLIYLGRIVVLGRLLSPEEFGLFAVALVALDFLMAVTDFGMVPALVHRPGAERRHYEAAWTIGLVRAAAVSAVLIAGAPWVAQLFGEPRAAPLLRLLAVRPLLEATASIGVARLRKELRFRDLAVLRLSEASVNAVVSILLVASIGIWALVAGPIAAALVYAILSYVVAPVRPRLRFGGESRELARYGRWILVAAFSTLAGRTLLEMGISRQLGAGALGLYFMARKLAFFPADISTQVVASVAFPVFAKLQEDIVRGRQVFRAALVGLTLLIVPICLLLIVLAPSLAVDVLGGQWVEAVDLIRILAAVVLIEIISDVAVPLLQGTGRPDQSATLNIVQYTILVTLAWVLAEPFGVEGAAAAWLPATLVSQLLAIGFVRRLLERPFHGLGSAVLLASAAAVLAAVIAVWIDKALGGAAGALVALAAGMLVAVGLIATADRRFDLGVGVTIGHLFPKVAPLLDAAGFRSSATPDDGSQEGTE